MIGQEIVRSGINVSIKVVHSSESPLIKIIKDDWKKKRWTGVTHPKLLTAHEKYHNQAPIVFFFFIVKGKLKSIQYM